MTENSTRRWELALPAEDGLGRVSSSTITVNKPDLRALSAALTALDRRATQEFLDKGIRILYLTLGMLEWVDDDDKPVMSPVLLVPVSLQRASPRDPFRLVRAESDVVSNPALAAKLEQYGIDMPEFDPTEADADPVDYLDQVSQVVREKKPAWVVTDVSVIRAFSFHKEVMYRDLEVNREAVLAHPLIRALAGERDNERNLEVDPVDEDELDARVPPEQMVSILDADASQRRCIDAARRGSSFVMDGPPGTGKSQTIANMIAELMRAGKTVLFVSEKAAALDVVRSRLGAAGLGDYILELHSQKSGRKQVAQELGRALTMHPRPPAGVTQLERAQATRQRQELNAYAAAVNEVRQPLGQSFQRVVGRTAQLGSLPVAPALSTIGADLQAEQLAQLLEVAGRLANAWGPVELGEDFLWRGARPGTRPQQLLQECAREIAEVRELGDELAAQLRLPAPEDRQGVARVAEVHDHYLAAPAGVPASWWTSAQVKDVARLADELRRNDEALTTAQAALQSAVGARWQDVDPDDAGRLEVALEAIGQEGRGWSLPEVLQPTDLANLVDLLSSTPDVLARVSRAADRIAQAFDVATQELTLQRALELAELARLSTAPTRPEATWLRGDVVDRLQQASQVLEQLVQASHAQREQLGQVFREQVVTLDLAALQQRHATQHQWWRRLGGAYRADKRQLQEVTISGKVDKQTWALLPQAHHWQGLLNQMAGVQQQQAGELGPAYWHGEQTDFRSLASALHLAQTALNLLGQQITSAAARQLSRTERPDQTLGALGHEIDRLLRPLVGSYRQHLGQAEHWLLPNTVAEVRTWAGRLLEPMRVVADVSARTSAIGGSSVAVGALRMLLEQRDRQQHLREDHEARSTPAREALGDLYRGLATDWGAVVAALDWWRALSQLLPLPLSRERAAAAAHPPPRTTLRSHLGLLEKQLDDVVGCFEPDYRGRVVTEVSGHLGDIAEFIDELSGTIGQIDEWDAYQQSRRILSEAGLEPVVTFCIERRVPAEAVVGVCERAVLEAWTEAVLGRDDRLSARRSADRDALVEGFRQLDERLVTMAASEVMAACNARRPKTTMGPVAVINREANKKTRHMPVRKLLDETRDIAQALKPCFMMSPLTVSQFLPSTLAFDVVIFDEASQVRPADAMNCIYRGKALIVAGDQKQLPPTSFWTSTDDVDEDYDEGQLEAFDSVLDLGKGTAGLSALSLRWHYRSQHESLITFSNYSFYEGRLVTFPGATAVAEDVGVAFYQVDGVYRRGGARDNPVEAAKVAERVFHHSTLR